MEQDQVSDQFATFFSRSISLLKRFQALQEVKTAVEPLQGEEMVSINEPSAYAIGSMPHVVRHDRSLSSEDSWCSLEMD